MPKVLEAYNTDYKIAVQESGTITLDTGDQTGFVIITGNLQVEGNTTTIDTVNLEIEDNILVLNRGEGGSGISENTAGIEIERGTEPSARWIFDEGVSWTLGGISGNGTFYASRTDGQKLPLNTPGIVSQGNFYVDTGEGIITVTNTPNYEEGVFNYVNGSIQPDGNGFIIIDDDGIPNAKAVKDYIDYNFRTQSQDFISQGDTLVETIDESHPLLSIISINDGGNNTSVLQIAGAHGFVEGEFVNITGIQANGDSLEDLNGTNIEILQIINQNVFRIDVGVVGADVNQYIQNSGTVTKTSFQESRIKFQVQGSSIADFYENRIDTGSLELKGTQIQTTESNSDLVLKSSGIGSVQIDDTLEINSLPYDDDFSSIPNAPVDGVKLFSQNPSTGKTGLYYINNNTTTDEIVSKNRSLLFSMLF